MQLYTGPMNALSRFLMGDPNIPRGVKEYFLPTYAMRMIRARSMHRTEYNDLDSNLREFGATALMFRTIQLCKHYPKALKNELKDFRRVWQWKEIENVVRSKPELDLRSAHTMYALCTLITVPARLPGTQEELQALLNRSPTCSPWASLLALKKLKAFQEWFLDAA